MNQALTLPEVKAETAPTLPLMHAIFVLSGLGTMLLGPILPLLAARWHLKDAQSGLLVLAQFCGATVGGSTTSRKLHAGLMVGLSSAVVGYLGFAFSPGLAVACGSLAVAGFGVGRVVTAINILAGSRYTTFRASALSWLNFSWSFGALLSPLSAAWLASRVALPHLLLVFALLFATVAGAFALQLRSHGRDAEPLAEDAAGGGLQAPVFLYFAALLLLYGGLETCLSAWLTTYALRYGQTSLMLSEYTMVLFLCGLTGGRALAAFLLRHVRDLTLQRVALLLAAGLAGALAASHSAGLIATLAVVLGICLAPIFPATFALVLAQGPRARQAGLILAASGVGAAALPSLMGVISTRTGSLQVALALPAGAALLMLLLTILPMSKPASQP